MRGITEERLRELRKFWQSSDARYWIDEIMEECTELNPWLPIDSAPKDRQLLGYREHIRFLFEWCPTHFRWEDECGVEVYPDHWQELPEDPK